MTSKSPRPLVPFAHHARVETVNVGRTRIPEAPELTNHIGSVHAGALFTLAETASGSAMVGAFSEQLAAGVRPLVRKSEIRFLRVARGEIVATAQMLEPAEAIAERLAREGRTDFEVTVALTDPADQTVAEMSVTWNLAKPRETSSASR